MLRNSAALPRFLFRFYARQHLPWGGKTLWSFKLVRRLLYFLLPALGSLRRIPREYPGFGSILSFDMVSSPFSDLHQGVTSPA